jgi:hypothetical protein
MGIRVHYLLMATNLLDDAHRRLVLDRIARLEPDTARRWGTMSCQQMLCHLGDQMRVALGDHAGKDRSTLASTTLIKWLVLYVPMRPPRGRVQTVPEMLATKPSAFEADRQRLLDLVERLVVAETVHPHPVFGVMSHRQWGRLAARHFDHHLRQFGV